MTHSCFSSVSRLGPRERLSIKTCEFHAPPFPEFPVRVTPPPPPLITQNGAIYDGFMGGKEEEGVLPGHEGEILFSPIYVSI